MVAVAVTVGIPRGALVLTALKLASAIALAGPADASLVTQLVHAATGLPTSAVAGAARRRLQQAAPAVVRFTVDVPPDPLLIDAALANITLSSLSATFTGAGLTPLSVSAPVASLECQLYGLSTVDSAELRAVQQAISSVYGVNATAADPPSPPSSNGGSERSWRVFYLRLTVAIALATTLFAAAVGFAWKGRKRPGKKPMGARLAMGMRL